MSARPKVGDTLICRSTQRYGTTHEVTVTKVGRKWAYAGNLKFDLDTGWEDGRGYSSYTRTLSVERWAEEDRRKAVTEQLRTFDIRPYDLRWARASVSDLERLVALLVEILGDRS